MKRILSFAAAAMLLVCAGCSSDKYTVDRLHVEGNSLVNSAGEQVVLKGVSIGWHNLWPRFYNAGAIATMHNDWGCNLFRVAIGADDLDELLNGTTDHPGYISDPKGALKKVFAVVDAAIANDSYVIVDWHSHLIHSEAAREFFTAVVNRYKGVPNVMYELFNEPVSFAYENDRSYSDLGDPQAIKSYWTALRLYAVDLMGLIAEIDDTHPVILMGCPCWDQRIDLPASSPIPGYDNLMYTLHFYAATHKDSLREAADAAFEAGTPIFISECAAMEASGDGPLDLESWKAWTDWAASKGISVVCWSLADKDESCSMLTSEASSKGPWPDEVIKPWGAIVKEFVK